MRYFMAGIVSAVLLSSPTYAAEIGSRAYTVAEIDALRETVERHFLFGCYTSPVDITPSVCRSRGNSVAYTQESKAKVVEERVRTWMLAGKTAQDLINSEH